MTERNPRAQAVVDEWLKMNPGTGPVYMLNPDAVECILAAREYQTDLYTKPRRFARLRAFTARLKAKP